MLLLRGRKEHELLLYGTLLSGRNIPWTNKYTNYRLKKKLGMKKEGHNLDAVKDW
jgi:hypothetical protein